MESKGKRAVARVISRIGGHLKAYSIGGVYNKDHRVGEKAVLALLMESPLLSLEEQRACEEAFDIVSHLIKRDRDSVKSESPSYDWRKMERLSLQFGRMAIDMLKSA
ncbi:hypothetical protein HZC00_01385 [Candidatus Kaiserbacteria bacterium]|nr:hypothetical protein [Candidatus Kaiserbacteria bacterium]